MIPILFDGQLLHEISVTIKISNWNLRYWIKIRIILRTT